MIGISSGKDNCLVTIDNNGKEYDITYEMLEKYSEYVNEDEVEGYFFDVVDDRYVVGAVFWASGQGGLIVVWDGDSSELIHVSEGAYTITATIHNDVVYSLADVSNMSGPPEQLLCSIKLGIMDANAEGDSVKVTGLLGDPLEPLDNENCRIEFEEGKVIVRNLSNNKKVVV